MADFLMPALGADMERGKIVEWLVKPGDFVHRGDLMAEVDTDKAVMDVESFEDGVVGELLVEVGTTVPVGAPLARIVPTPAVGAERRPEPAPEPAPEPVPPPAPAAAPHGSDRPRLDRTGTERPGAVRTGAVPVSPPVRHLAQVLGVDLATIRGTGKHGAVIRADVEKVAGTVAEPTPPPPRRGGAERVPASPLARRLARELGVEMAGIVGSGPRGAVTAADLRRAGEQDGASKATVGAAPARAPETPGAGRADTVGGAERSANVRRAIGSLMAKSKQTIPHYYLGTTIGLTAVREWLTTVNADRPVSARLVPAVLLLKATARAATSMAEVNGFYRDGVYEPSAAVHLGVAISLRGGGLVAPAIHDADALSLDDLSVALRDLVMRARGGRLQRAEMADPTLTVTNLGDLGVESVFGVIYPPQVALVGFGRLREEPYAHEGMLGIRPVVSATLSADHRVSDGLHGGRFLERIDELLQEPETL